MMYEDRSTRLGVGRGVDYGLRIYFYRDFFDRHGFKKITKNMFLVTNEVVTRDLEVLRWAIDAESQDLAI